MNTNESGLRNNELISELLISGSPAIHTKNDSGVYMFDDYNKKDGVIYDSVSKPKYNENELQKVVDTVIVELLPTELPEYQPTVLRDLFDAAVAAADILSLENEDLRQKLSVCESAITGLENTLENALVDIDQKDLLLAAAENQSKQSNEKVSSTIQELQNAIQRATAESIERSKLAANNAAIADQLKAYKKQLDTSITTLNTSNVKLSDLTKTNQSLQSTIISSDSTISNLQARITGLQSTINDFQSRNTDLQIKNTNLENRNTNLQSALIEAGKKKKIICNMLYNQGFIPEHIWAADQLFGSYMIENHRDMAIGYLIWARYVVRWFTKYPQYSKYLYILVKPWSEHMAYTMNVLDKDNFVGNVIHKVGGLYSLMTYKYYELKRKFNRKFNTTPIWQ